MKISSLWKSVTILGIAAMALGFSACGDDAAGPDPNAGIKAPVTLLNVNPGFPLPVNFADGSDNVATSVAYGVPTVIPIQIGTRTIAIKGTDGTGLASSGVQVDSSRPTWVIHTGSTNASEAIGIDAVKNNADIQIALNGGAALVRFVNASKNAGNATLKIGTAIGSKVAENIAYKSVSGFAAVDTAAKSLILTKGTTSDTLAVPPIATPSLVPGKLYTVVLYGSSDASAAAEQKLMAKIVAEP